MPPKRGGPASQRERGAKRRAVAALGVGVVAQDMAQQQVDRAFWGQYSTSIIWAWATDYNGAPEFTLEQRDAKLSFLVAANGGHDLPPLFHAEVADASSDRDDALSSPAPVAPRLAVALLPLPTRVQSPPAAASSAAVFSSAVALTKTISFTTAESSSAGEQQRQCLTCARISPAQSHMFLCGGCGRRGDLRFDDPINQTLVPPPASAGSSAPSSSAASSAGQLPSSTPKLSALDAEFVALLKAGRPQLSFGGSGADAPVPLSRAIQEVQRALSASETQQPSEHFLDLIRAGKLRHVGHAIPRPHTTHGKDEHAMGTLSLSGDNVAVASKSIPVPVAANAQQFCMALFSTILPALLDKPQALLDWLTLGRTPRV